MKTWNLLNAGKIGTVAAMTAAVISCGASAEAAGGFFDGGTGRGLVV